MADNIAVTAGAGTTVAADDIGSVFYQRVKLSLGADGVANDAEAGAGAVDTGTLRTTLASDDPLVTMVTAPATGTQTSVAASASDGTILASNASRKGAYIYNDSTVVLYILLSNAVSSATSMTRPLAAGEAMYILPGSYTGVIKGIWVSATGSARVTEWT
jgi:hypothetical protein